MVTLNESTTFQNDDAVELTPGEEAILMKLDELQGQLDELTAKVDNLNLSYNDGFGIES